MVLEGVLRVLNDTRMVTVRVVVAELAIILSFFFEKIKLTR